MGDFKCEEVSLVKENKKGMSLLDLYSGCGAMSTGLCLGAKLLDVNLVTVSSTLVPFFTIKSHKAKEKLAYPRNVINHQNHKRN